MTRSAAIVATVALALSGALVGIAAPASAVEPASNKTKAITLAEVRKHNKATDCWAVMPRSVWMTYSGALITFEDIVPSAVVPSSAG